jgi:hypothetical protein
MILPNDIIVYCLFITLFVIIGIIVYKIFRLIKYKNLTFYDICQINTTVGLDDKRAIRAYFGVHGVWAIYVGDICWDVCKTSNIGSEMMLGRRRIKSGLGNVIRNNDWILRSYKYNRSSIIKYKDLVKFAIKKKQLINFRILITDISDDAYLEFYEMKYAIENDAIAWNPAPGKQTKAYYKWKKNGGRIKKYYVYFKEN